MIKVKEVSLQVQCHEEGGLPQGQMSASIIVKGAETNLEPLEDEANVNTDGYRYFEFIPR